MTTPTQRALALVRDVGTIHLEGNIVPHTWYRHLKHADGKPDLVAITLLSEIVYWYRPGVEKDERGKVVRYYKRFEADKLRKSHGELAEEFGLTKRQVRSALDYLEEFGVITTELRNVKVNGVQCNNVLFIEIVPGKLREICMPPEVEVRIFNPPSDSHVRAYDVEVIPFDPYDSPYDHRSQTNTETTQRLHRDQLGRGDAPLSADAAPAREEKSDYRQSKRAAKSSTEAATPVADNLQSPKPRKVSKHTSLIAQFGETAQQAIRLYHAAFGRYPNEIQMRDIADKVTDLDRWQQVLDDWQLNGWNCTSVGKMTARYQKPKEQQAQQSSPPGRRRGVLSGNGDEGPKIDKSKLAFLQPPGGGAHG